jgi:hypothetical protein
VTIARSESDFFDLRRTNADGREFSPFLRLLKDNYDDL